MEIVLAISGVVASAFTVIGVLWTITFGGQSIAALFSSSRKATSEVKVKTMSTTRSKATRKVTAPVREKPSGNGLPFWRQWVAATGRTVFGCWFGWEEYWEDWSTSEFSSTRLTLSALAGLAMRVMLVLAPILLTLGLTLWAVGSVFSRHTIPLIGEACLAGFLVAVASGFFLLGLIGVVAFFTLVFGRDY